MIYIRGIYICICIYTGASLVAQMVKNLPAMWETRVRSLGWEDCLEKGKATHSSILAWRIPWTKEPGRLQSMGSEESDMTERLTLSHINTYGIYIYILDLLPENREYFFQMLRKFNYFNFTKKNYILAINKTSASSSKLKQDQSIFDQLQ